MRTALVLPAALPLFLLLAVAPPPSDASPVVVRQTLQSGGADADARGTAVFKVRGRGSRRSGTLVVTAQRLESRSSYEVTVDGVRVGSLGTSRRGSGRARFGTAPRGDDQFLGVDPRGRSVALVRAGGSPVLAGSLPTKGLDPGDVRCCLPDDSGTECEDRTPAECAAQGGVDLGPGSCLPDPCGGATSPVGDVRCCLPDDSGPECEDRTAAECAAQGGVNIGAGSCLPNPCGATTTPPAVGTPSVVVTCERRADRSRVSVNGKGLASGTYRARATSGGNTATATPRGTIGDEVEFDFDSAPDDVAAGATAIASTFLQGTPPQVTGAIETTAGVLVVESRVTCETR